MNGFKQEARLSPGFCTNGAVNRDYFFTPFFVLKLPHYACEPDIDLLIVAWL